jgi:alkylation response protein AidB-like acyl-CoA dehydrogenase
MEFRLDEAQVELQQTVARFCSDRFPFDSVLAREGQPTDRAHWAEMSSLGIFGLLLGEEVGGSGLGIVEGALLFEQLGSHLVPGPVLWTVLAAPVIEGAAAGEQLVGGVSAADVVDGAALVEHAADLDVLLVVHADGIVAHRTDSLPEPTPLDPLDPLTPVGRLTGLDGGRAGPASGEVVGGTEAATDLVLLGTVLSAAMLAGVAARALEVARAYALERHQFGAPIGSFQAVKHLLADMYVRGSLAQSATYAAAAVVQEPGRDDPARAASSAKLLAAEAAVANAGTAIQVLGGMGFTWDMLPNHLLKRAWVLEQSFGHADDHALRLGSTFAEVAR